MKIHFILMVLSFFVCCDGIAEQNDLVVKPGAQVLLEDHLEELKGKRIGLVMNQSARVEGTHMLDSLLALDINVTALFAPEHGFRGDAGAGEIIKDGIDQATNLPVYSLYGSVKKPTQKMLRNVDILLFDMQDVGARFYTYNTTMKYILEAAAEFNKEVWILDRPNPAGGDYVAGWVLEEEFQSFVGAYPIPVAHGLTLGELALMAVAEGWLTGGAKPDLKVIPMQNWSREMKWTDTGLPWTAPSPNLPSFEHAFVYLGTCFFEGTTLSEGRGTDDPFLTVGSPSTNIGHPVLIDLEKKYMVQLDTLTFTPRSVPGKALHPKFENQKSFGVKITTSSEFKDPVGLGIELLDVLMESSEGAEYRDFLYLLSGTKKIHGYKQTGHWGKAFDEFVEKREHYLLYH